MVVQIYQLMFIQMKKIFGTKFNKTIKRKLKARVCPKCGKVELFINVENTDNN